MRTITEKAYAKLNLSLDVLGKRPDGYHDLLMVMLSTELHDDVSVALRDDGAVTVHCNFPWIPTDERNLAVKAAREFFSRIDAPTLGADISICKRVPVGAGMAGGSTDAAAVLRALNELSGTPLSRSELMSAALAIGSDVPFCMVGGTKLAEGRGERLTALPELPRCPIVICKPRFSVSTAELFSRVDSRTKRTHPDTDGIIACLRTGDTDGVAKRMFNVFEDVVPKNCQEVFSIRSSLLSFGALGAVMTGTGSAVFGIFPSVETAERCRAELSAHYKECFLTYPMPSLL